MFREAVGRFEQENDIIRLVFESLMLSALLRIDCRGVREGARHQLGGKSSGKGKRTCVLGPGVNIGIGLTSA